jgi:hypothetical protein
MLGVSKNGVMKVTTETKLNTLKSDDLGDSKDYVFSFTSNDVANSTGDSRIKQLCLKCAYLGITWEGIYDGDTCTGIANSARAAASDSASCSK